jgi:hypothetical protein
LAQLIDDSVALFFRGLQQLDRAARETVGFSAAPASFENGKHFSESDERFTILALHAESGFGEEAATVGSDFVDGA